ncbi:ribokinase [Sinosporangium siamense]|uniref:Ribokinase n=1 Tax=Sinosporangium siamense TaxID=1367973 RepID=A0A919RBK0_9ACTN|nr:ribokinase [Sinosporangium siamense]GII90653.1 ribokinase [Sinosporangium siamense]
MLAVYGSANMDVVAYVSKAPQRGETVTGRAFRTIPGGKGANQAIAAARAGADVAFLGAVGDDAFGAGLRRTLADAGVSVERLRTVPGPSGVAHIVVDDGAGNSIIVVPGANGTLTGPDAGDRALLAGASALLLQLELPMSAVIAAARAAREARVQVVLTPAPVVALPAELLECVTLIVPNEHEAEGITGCSDPGKALSALLDLVPEAVVTLGGRGAVYGSRTGERLTEPARRVRAVDTTAAGDTFVGALAVARTEGRPPAQALRFASAAASLAVQREGASTSMPLRAEIDEVLEAHRGA